jgi:glucose/arabinose dehydrogenase
VEQDGKIRLVKDGVLQPTAFLDITALTQSPADGGGNEQGLLGLAFHPNYASNGWFFVYHTEATWNNLLVRYTRSASDPDRADSASRQVVMTYNHPNEWNHNGGMIAFGPHGHLFIGTGDGGNGCDPNANAQNPSSPLGKLHRINVDSLPYTVPSTNPFVGSPGYLPEIWALGLRNPWRFSFDSATGDLYIGEVGEDNWEEIDFAPAGTAGLNCSWDRYEAAPADPSLRQSGNRALSRTARILSCSSAAAPGAR